MVVLHGDKPVPVVDGGDILQGLKFPRCHLERAVSETVVSAVKGSGGSIPNLRRCIGPSRSPARRSVPS